MYRLGPIARKSNFRIRERMLIGLVFVVLCVLGFGTIFLLPDNFGGERVMRVYKHLQRAGPEIFMPPAPPIAMQVPAPHTLRHAHGDRQRLQQKIKEELGNILDIPPLQDVNSNNNNNNNNNAGRLLPQAVDGSDDYGGAGGELDPQQGAAPPVVDNSGSKTLNDAERIYPMGGGESVEQETAERREKIKEMMTHAWSNYKLYAWGKNELRPLTQRGHSNSIFGAHDLGATIIDGLDTLYIMGLEDEYREGRDWIEHKFTLANVSQDLSVFETNIRFIGGMLTMYAFTGDNMYKEKARHVADVLLPAFQTPTGIPYALINPKTSASKNYGWASTSSSILSEFGTLHLEFSYLSDITGNPVYRQRVDQIRKVLHQSRKFDGLYPNYMNPKTGVWGQRHMSLGALGDSFYEYLLKAWLQSGKQDVQAREMFDDAMIAINNKMVRTSPGGLLYVLDIKYERLEHKMGHLACFAGGLYALGANTSENDKTEGFMEIAKGITNTCHESYIRATTRLGPETFRFTENLDARTELNQESYYILRPETFESYFILWRLTHDQKYRDWGWDAVQALEKHCRSSGGYSGIKNVYQQTPFKDDVQQSFFLAETLKYLYLLFSDDSLLPLDQWVFNTEAHPLPIKGANKFYRSASSNAMASHNL